MHLTNMSFYSRGIGFNHIFISEYPLVGWYEYVRMNVLMNRVLALTIAWMNSQMHTQNVPKNSDLLTEWMRNVLS